MENLSTKDEILRTSIELFKEFGYKKVTIDQICTACGISKTTFYYYYKSKESLIADFYNQTDAMAKDWTAEILAAENAVEQLWKICDLYMQPFVEVGAVITKEIFQINLKNDYLKISPDDIYLKDVMIMLIKRGQEAGQITNMTDAETLYKQVIYLMDGISFIWAIKNCSFDLQKESRESFDALLFA